MTRILRMGADQVSEYPPHPRHRRSMRPCGRLAHRLIAGRGRLFIKLYAKIVGGEHSEAIIFLPGFTGSHEVWDKHFQSLGREYKLVLLDTLGFGRSPKPDIAYSVEDHLDAIHSTLQELEINKAHIVGHSAGTLLALAYAHRFPHHIAKLALLATPWFRSESEARQAIKNSSLFNRLLALDTPLAHFVCEVMCLIRPLLMPIVPWFVQDVPAGVARDALRHNWHSYSRTMQNVVFRLRPQEFIRDLPHPILMIHGTEDRTAPIKAVREAAHLPPHARLIELEAGHGLIFTHSAEVSEKIVEFLRPI